MFLGFYISSALFSIVLCILGFCIPYVYVLRDRHVKGPMFLMSYIPKVLCFQCFMYPRVLYPMGFMFPGMDITDMTPVLCSQGLSFQCSTYPRVLYTTSHWPIFLGSYTGICIVLRFYFPSVPWYQHPIFPGTYALLTLWYRFDIPMVLCLQGPMVPGFYVFRALPF